jgi:hypothetical protein
MMKILNESPLIVLMVSVCALPVGADQPADEPLETYFGPVIKQDEFQKALDTKLSTGRERVGSLLLKSLKQADKMGEFRHDWSDIYWKKQGGPNVNQRGGRNLRLAANKPNPCKSCWNARTASAIR